MKCAEICLRLEDYSYNELSDLESIAIAAHLRDCPSCSKYYQTILKENEVFADYLPNLEINASLWASVQERISSVESTKTIHNTSPFPQIPQPQTSLVIRPRSTQFISLDNKSIWTSLAKVIGVAFQDFRANPALFFRQMFQQDNFLARDKNYWQTGKTIAIVLWLFSTISYVSVFQRVPRGFEKTEKLEKIVDLAPLPFPKELIPRNHQSNAANPSKEKTPLLEPRLAKGNIVSSTNSASTNPIINVPSLPNVLTPGELPDNSSPNLTLGIPNNGISNGVLDGSGAGSGKTSGDGTGSSQANIGAGNNSGKNSGQGPMIVEDEIIYNIYDNSVISPRILSKPSPHYTEEARREKIKGKVILSVVFNKTASITNIQVIHSLGYGLDEEAIKTASQVKFIPATRNGVRVSVKARLEYTFTLF